MKPMMHPDMIEATRLTREGRLTEATALLQRMLQSGLEPDASTGEPRAVADAPQIAAGPIIELTPEVIEESARRRSSPPGRAEADLDASLVGSKSATPGTPMPDWLRGLIAKVGRSGSTPLRARRPATRLPADAPSVVPRGGRFVTATFTGEAGTRAYKLYIPSAYKGQPLPLVVMLHGCTQSADDFAAGTRMNMMGEEHAFFVAYPAQPKSANGAKCWNWFKPGDQQRGRGEPSLISGITRQISRDYAIDRQRVYVAGLSAGGAAAAIMGATYPDIYAAVGVHSGLPCGAASDLPSAFSAMRQGSPRSSNSSPRSPVVNGSGRLVPTIVFHGDKDAIVHPRNGHQVIEQFRSIGLGELRSATQPGRVASGRTYSRTRHFDASGRVVLEMWIVHGAGHAWSGGSPAGSYTDPHGPDASREMARFFLEHSHPASQLDATPDEVALAGGKLVSKRDASRAVSIADAMRHAAVDRIEQEKSTSFPQGGTEAPRPDPRKDIPEKMEPDSSSRGSSQGDGSLSDRLGRTDGVITPPSDTTPSMTVPAPVPDPGTTPVIPPPGSPGNPSPVRPK